MTIGLKTYIVTIMKLFLGCLVVLAGCGASPGAATNNPDASQTSDSGSGVPSDGGVDGTGTMPDASTVCTADTMNDANNCGICGRSCLGGSCSMGMCTATLVNANDVITGVGDFVSDGVFIYYSGFTTGTGTNHRLWRHVLGVNTTGDYVDTFANATPLAEVAFDGTYLYSADPYATGSVSGFQGEVKRANKTPFGGGAIEQLQPTTTTAVFVQGGTVYWATDVSAGDAGDIRNVPVTGGSISTVTAAAGQVYYLTGDANNLYWVDNAGGGLSPALRTAPIAGGATVDITAGTADFIDMDASYVYTLFKNTGDVVQVAKSNNHVATIGHSFTAGVAVDDKYVYGAKTNQLVGITKGGAAVAPLWVGAPEGTMNCPTTLKISRVKVIGNYVYFLVLPTTCNNTVLANRIYRTARL